VHSEIIEKSDTTDKVDKNDKADKAEKSEKDMKGPVFTAICGVKNSGKTTLTEGIIRTLTARGLRTAVIKHDGHEFECDIAGTDSSRFVEAGAFGAAVFSRGQIFVRKRDKYPDTQDTFAVLRLLRELTGAFAEADVILAEGLKGLPVPKIEVIRSAISQKPVSNPEGRFLVVSDLSEAEIGEKTLSFEDLESIADEILQNARRLEQMTI
jgi:molybdopterin-guanine dinucleotide biosynthesis protein B